jgi:hypothetical protein
MTLTAPRQQPTAHQPVLGDSTVARLWTTPVIFDMVNLDGMVNPELTVDSAGPRLEYLPTHAVLLDMARLTKLLLTAFTVLAEADEAPPPRGVEVEVQVWRQGHDVPAASFAADYIAWLFVVSNPGPNRETGSLSLADPRAGSDMTAMPGLPWGRTVFTNPIPGGLLAHPGWVTSSIVPLAAGQYTVAVHASSVR